MGEGANYWFPGNCFEPAVKILLFSRKTAFIGLVGFLLSVRENSFILAEASVPLFYKPIIVFFTVSGIFKSYLLWSLIVCESGSGKHDIRLELCRISDCSLGYLNMFRN